MLSEHVYVLMLRIWYGEFGRVGPGEASGRGVRGVVAAAQQEEAVIVVECQGHLCRMMVSMTLWSHLPLLTEPPPINSHAMQVNNTLFFFLDPVDSWSVLLSTVCTFKFSFCVAHVGFGYSVMVNTGSLQLDKNEVVLKQGARTH